MSIKKQAIKGVKWTTLNTIVLSSSTLLKISVLARLLDTADFGIMAILTFVMGFVNLFMDMGMSIAILHKQKISVNEYSSLYWINIFFSVILFVLIFLISPSIAVFYNEESLKVLIPLMGTSVLIAAIGKQFKTILQKQLNFRKIAIIEITASILSLILAIVLALNNFGIYSLIYSLLANFLIVNLVFLVSGYANHPIKFHYRFHETKSFLKIGVYQVGSQIVNYFNRDLDILLIGKFFGVEILGGYSLAKQLVFRPAQIINPIITQVATPLLAKMQGNLLCLKNNYLKLLKLVSSVNFIAYILIILFAPILVDILYGNEYENIVTIVRILSVYMYVRALGNPIGSLVVATGKTHLEFYWNLFTLIVLPVFIFIGASISLEFVALLITVAMIILIIPNWFFLVKKMIDVKLNKFLYALIPSLYWLQIKRLLTKI